MIRKRTYFIIGLVFILLAGGAFLAWRLDLLGRWKNFQVDRERDQILDTFNATAGNQTVPALPVPEVPIIPVANQDTSNWSTEIENEVPLPEKVLLDVQFIPQGPLDPGPAHWAAHAESCEEAAAIMAHNYAVDRSITMQEAEDEIWKLVDWQVENLGDEHDIYAEETARLLKEYYGHTDVRVLRDVTPDDLKRELAAGRPVIVPAIAAPLKNPRYREQGYHMFVLVGYTADRFIANDNGTTWGENYPYPYDDLMEALRQAGGDALVIHK